MMFRRLVLVMSLALVAACSKGPQLSKLPGGAVILAFGDSLTYGTGVVSEHSYPEVLAGLSGFKVVRSGVPGEISRQGKARLVTELVEHRPALVILCHGGNDVLRRLAPEKTEQNLREMIQLVRDSGADVVLVAVPEFGLFPEPPDFYEQIASQMEVPVEHRILSSLMSNRAMKSDQIHFNRAGYRQMAVAVHELLIDAGAL
ncbi:MAG: GDSL-type esterase/lipase family protein [Pseudomonadales bacterium]